jgi:hypothetical protein
MLEGKDRCHAALDFYLRQDENTKRRYKSPYGDLKKVTAAEFCLQKAGPDNTSTLTSKGQPAHLHGMIDETANQPKIAA